MLTLNPSKKKMTSNSSGNAKKSFSQHLNLTLSHWKKKPLTTLQAQNPSESDQDSLHGDR